MGADTRYYVKVVKLVEEWSEVNALTAEEAKQKARLISDVIDIKDVKHWSYFEETDGC